MIQTIRSRVRSRVLLPVTLLTLILASLSHVVMEAADGALDATFGVGGKVTLNLSNTVETATAVAVQSDGKIVVAGDVFLPGGLTRMSVTRLLPNGAVDTTFGVSGRVMTAFPGSQSDEAAAVAIQQDNKIVLAGRSNGRFAVVRYHSNGSLDASFGSGGLVTTFFADTSGATAVALQHDGKIIAGGTKVVGAQVSRDFALARYNPDGSLDLSFDGDGRVITTFNQSSALRAVAVQSDGKIVAMGEGHVVLFMARFSDDGSLDPTFGSNGRVTTTGLVGHALAIQPDGRIVAAGGALGDFGLARYDADGTLDPTFGVGGIVTTDISGTFDNFVGVGLQADGKIVAVGDTVINPRGVKDFVVARYDVNGALDPSFGTGGRTITHIAVDEARGMTVQSDGRVIVVGGALFFSPFEQRFTMAVLRYEGPPSHELRFFPHGTDIPGTAGALTMSRTAPSAQTVIASGLKGQSWLSDAVMTGTFVAGSTIQLQLPCVGFRSSKRIRFATTDENGATLQLLGEALQFPQLCTTPLDRVDVKINAPATVTNGRLKLTIGPMIAGSVPVLLGSNTFVRATAFVGVP